MQPRRIQEVPNKTFVLNFTKKQLRSLFQFLIANQGNQQTTLMRIMTLLQEKIVG